MRPRRRDLALLALGGAHLLFVANAALGLVAFGGPLAYVAGFYGNVTGAETGYTFFAPRVPFEVRPHVQPFDAHGRPLPSPPLLAREERFRQASLGLFFVQQQAPGLAGAALAADAFGRVPEARTVTVTLTMHVLPTMAEYRQGARPVDDVVYEGEFARDDG